MGTVLLVRQARLRSGFWLGDEEKMAEGKATTGSHHFLRGSETGSLLIKPSPRI